MTLADAAGWIAPIATMIAAIMTAANLGARITGWGFVVFAMGSIAWTAVGLSSGQANLVATNAFLTVVNLGGIWRWLGRQQTYDDGGKSAELASRRAAAPSLFTATGVAGMPVTDMAGEPIGRAVEALIECGSGEISYVVVARGGVGGIDESLRAVPRADIRFSSDRLTLFIDAATFEGLAILHDGDWPAKA